MKRLLSLLLAAVLCLMGTAAAAQENIKTLTVGHTTRVSGSFFSDMWGMNTSDIDVRKLLHGYPTVVWTVVDGETQINRTAVGNVTTKLDKEGNKTYTINLRQSLKFSDGSQISAKDYVFSLLLQTSPVIKQIGGVPASKDHIVGYEEYLSGESDVFSGVRLEGEFSFSITVKKDYLPHFYEYAFIHVIPYPIAVIAPGAMVADDGKGAYIKGDFTAEILTKTILDKNNGYLSHPMVTSGPYKLESYDHESGTVILTRNDYFNGNQEKVKAKIERLVLKPTKNSTMLDELKSGQIDLINKISSGDVINKLDEIVAGGEFKNQPYLRRGLAYLSFAMEEGLSRSLNIRKALAHLIDKDMLVDEFLKGHGEAVYAHYGIGQWMAQFSKDKLKELDIYKPNVDSAKELVIKDGFTLNEKGEEFLEGRDNLRYKKDGDNLIPLSLKLLITKDNEAANITSSMLEKGLEKIGGSLQIESVDMDELLMRYYRQKDRNYDLAFLGTNFNFVYEPYYFFNTNENFVGASYNTTAIADDKLLQLANDLRHTQAGDVDTYLQRWFDFQKQFAELLPMIPLYSNIYHDAYTARLENYHPEFHSSWAAAILYATLK